MTPTRPSADRGHGLALFGAALGLIGLLAFLAGVRVDPGRAFFAYLAAYMFGLSFPLGALLMVMLSHLTAATWFVAQRRAAETVAATTPVFVILFVPILFGLGILYPWAAPTDDLTADALATLAAQRPYFDLPFFLTRAAVYFAIWIAASHVLLRASYRQDAETRNHQRYRMTRLSAIFLPPVFFAITFASFDWTMSIHAGWVSTIWGVYAFAGAFTAAMGLLAILGWAMARATPRTEMQPRQTPALAGVLITMVLFWGYIAYAQYVVVWIANVPREAAWYLPRVTGEWIWVARVLLIGNFAIPLLVLLLRRVRLSPHALAALGGWLIVMHYVDIYWLILPTLEPETLRPHWLDGASLLMVVGPTILWGAWRFRAHPGVPIGDPRLEAAAGGSGWVSEGRS